MHEFVYFGIEIYTPYEEAVKHLPPRLSDLRAGDYRRSMSELLPPHVLSGLGGLDFIARRVVSGAFAGVHRATMLGAGREFDRHRAYQQGDESRHIDWRLYARSDRLYVRQFREESSLQAYLLLDDSASMAFAGRDGLTKFRYAQMLAAVLAHLMLLAGDTVGLARTARGGELLMRPRNRRGHLHDVLLALERLSVEGATTPDSANAVDRVATALPRRGRLVLITDLLEEEALERTVPALGRLSARGDEVVVLRVLTPEEEGRVPLGLGRYFDPERPEREIPAAPDVDAAYGERVRGWFAALDRALAARGVESSALATDTPLAEGIAGWLGRRAA